MGHTGSAEPVFDVRAIILAGGSSTRFGSDKAVFEVAGLSMAARVYRAVAAAIPEVAVGLCRSDQRNPLPGIPAIVDDPVGAGPLGSIRAGLRMPPGGPFRPDGWLLVAACDMPGLRPEHVRTLVGALERGLDAVVASGSDGRDHPLFGCYAATCLPALEAFLASGRRSMHGLLSGIRMKRCPLPDGAVRNANTPSDAHL